MKTYGGVDIYIHIFLTSAPVGGEWSASRPGRFTPGERAPGTHWIGGWVGPRAGLDNVEKRKFLTIPGLEIRPLGHAARSQWSGCIAPPFLNSAISGGKWSASHPGRFAPEEISPNTHWIGGWVDHRAYLDSVNKRNILSLPDIETV
jgi:hypothetical protein